MALPPTDTVKIRDVLRHAQKRSRETGRTQQVQIGEDLYCRVAPGGHRFLLFSLDDEPQHATAQAIAQGLGFEQPEYGWHQGATLRSLTVIDLAAPEGADPTAATQTNTGPEAAPTTDHD